MNPIFFYDCHIVMFVVLSVYKIGYQPYFLLFLTLEKTKHTRLTTDKRFPKVLEEEQL